jgi:hypothetical protein
MDSTCSTERQFPGLKQGPGSRARAKLRKQESVEAGVWHDACSCRCWLGAWFAEARRKVSVSLRNQYPQRTDDDVTTKV